MSAVVGEGLVEMEGLRVPLEREGEDLRLAQRAAAGGEPLARNEVVEQALDHGAHSASGQAGRFISKTPWTGA